MKSLFAVVFWLPKVAQIPIMTVERGKWETAGFIFCEKARVRPIIAARMNLLEILSLLVLF
jgi:hypothetical protein